MSDAPKTRKVQIDAKQLATMSELAKLNGTQDHFIALALEWSERATEYVEQLQAENERLKAENQVLVDWFDKYAGYSATHPAAPSVPNLSNQVPEPPETQ